ncbi:Nif11-like leader peptide family natural product precursor [Chamaesiphon sp. OTE_75_metabat_556]|uniref:Nif11-like leader peptide family natural product precursor n=1 Tax=Chamaesiphon sp. OTE_75_metabat_556 TaxID=2964692 RepID=UPI00286B96BE|nr:Nif11-like leader peptide family natural product precursor [Chamaesiphon sp. OTE_75_metabat_556]
MSLENVAAFYEKLGQDRVFCQQIKDADSESQKWQIIQAAGFDFSPAEYAQFTAQNFDLNESEIQDLSIEEMAGVVGGFKFWVTPMYGLTLPPLDLYGGEKS